MMIHYDTQGEDYRTYSEFDMIFIYIFISFSLNNTLSQNLQSLMTISKLLLNLFRNLLQDYTHKLMQNNKIKPQSRQRVYVKTWSNCSTTMPLDASCVMHKHWFDLNLNIIFLLWVLMGGLRWDNCVSIEGISIN